MTIRKKILVMHDEMKSWRHDLHRNPDIAFKEFYAEKFIKNKLDEFGVSYKSGIGKNGIVATIEGKRTDSGKAIGLRADMDALDITESSGQGWTSQVDGRMHGCGHDGHMTMLLGAAKYLIENNNFNGKVHLIFQPAEETLEGARAMLKDGLLEKFPCDMIFGMHNWPWLERGKFAMPYGPVMAATAHFDVEIVGKAGHAGMPHNTVDPVLIACEIITTVQTLVSRNTDPLESSNVYFPIFETGITDDGIVPEKVRIGGAIRTFSTGLRSRLEQRLRKICNHIASAYGGSASVNLLLDSDAVLNDNEAVDISRAVGSKLVGEKDVEFVYPPSMAGEDFGSYSQLVPSSYVFIGQGEQERPDDPHSYGLHSPYYDFNDEILTLGASYWVGVTEQAMPLD